jgi:hypothetical protein
MALFASMTVYSIKWPLFNYRRVSMWSTMSFAAVFGLVLINLLSWSTNQSSFPWLIMVFIFWAILVILGVFLQATEFPSRLRSEKHPDLQNLFAFAFRCNVNRDNISQTTNNRMFRSESIYAVKPREIDMQSSEDAHLSQQNLIPHIESTEHII